MSTLTSSTNSSPVHVVKVIADFRNGMPDAGLVLVGKDRHPVRVFHTPAGLIARCGCANGCTERAEAVRAVKVMAEAWGRTPRAVLTDDIAADMRLDPFAELDPERYDERPYDGLARMFCEADLAGDEVPEWAYEPNGIRRPAVDAPLAAVIWTELTRALDRVLGPGPKTCGPSLPRVLSYYRASWEPELGLLAHHSYDVDLPFGFDENEGVTR